MRALRMTPAERTRRILAEAGYLTLATTSADGMPWAAVLQFVVVDEPLRLLFCSAAGSRHGRHVIERPAVAGALFVTGDEGPIDVDGAQFTGSCRELDAAETAERHAAFHDALLPDEASRAAYTLPVDALLAPAAHRIYQITVDRMWLIDTSTWADDQIDRRMEVDLP